MRVKAAKLARLMLFPFPLLLLWFFFMPALARDIYGRLNGFATHFKYTKNNNFAAIFAAHLLFLRQRYREFYVQSKKKKPIKMIFITHLIKMK